MFADDAVGKVERYFPPKLEWLQAWALAFRCHLTFGNYLGYVNFFCFFWVWWGLWCRAGKNVHSKHAPIN